MQYRLLVDFRQPRNYGLVTSWTTVAKRVVVSRTQIFYQTNVTNMNLVPAKATTSIIATI